MCGSCFLIHSAALCVLIGAFIPLTFKVIIDRYVFIFLLLYLFSSLGHSFPFSFYRSSFCIAYSAGLVEVYSLSLLLSGKLLISPSILIETLSGVEYSGLQAFAFHYTEYFLPLSSGLNFFC